MDAISRKILERIENRLEKSGFEYGSDTEPITKKILGTKVHGHAGSVYTLTSDLAFDRRVTFIRLLGHCPAAYRPGVAAAPYWPRTVPVSRLRRTAAKRP